MKVTTDFAFEVDETTNFYIPVSDGVRLAARMWLPKGAKTNPVPAILEAIPYRKRDGTFIRDALTHPYLAGHGYACIRLDLRGCGESEGVFEDEYIQQEQDDIIDVIHWLAGQKWCNGNVGMMGISWGGFNSLQVAYAAPEPLKAIITLCSTHDRFNDDIHYKGGCLLMENIGWSGYMFNLLAMPPDPALDEEWRDKWEKRIEAVTPGGLTWLQHQTRDEYWLHGSVCTDYSAIKAATMVVTGWADAYVNNVTELLQNLQAPSRAIVGPWVHKYPHFAVPGPQIGFLQEALKWWDKWLKGVDNGVDKEPRVNLYLMDPYLPRDFYKHRNGNWICDDTWPNENIKVTRLFPNSDHRLETEKGEGKLCLGSRLTTGSAAGEYGTWMLGPEYPLDQRHDDADSLCFDHCVCRDMNIVGTARVRLRVRSDKPCGQIAVRLNDVHPTGDVTRISYGVLNLTLRESKGEVTPVIPGQWYDVEIPIDTVAYRVPQGHTLRLSISSAYFPLLWPAPEFCTLGFDLAACSVDIPLHNLASMAATSPFAEAEGAQGADLEVIKPVEYTREITQDAATGRVTTHIIDNLGEMQCNDMGDYRIGQVCEEIYSIEPHDPASARSLIKWNHTIKRDDIFLEFESEISFTSDRENFYFTAYQKISENKKEVSMRTWDEKIQRIAM